MASMRDLAIDLINEAKAAREGSAKLYLLEQVKEIVFRRDMSLISTIVSDVMSFMIEKSMPMRKFLIKFAGEAMRLNLAGSMVSFLTLIEYYVSSEVQENLLQIICNEIQSYYIDLIVLISSLPPKSKSSIGPDPMQLWTMLQTTVKFFLSAISSERSDNLRMACLKLSETVILFGLPPPPPITDPRLARAMKSEMASSSKSKNAEDIPLHHPFINRNDLIQEAEDLYVKMLLWSSKNGPQGFTFGTMMVSLLGELIASVAVSRPKKGPDAAKAITSMIQGKSSLCSSMTSSEREKLARASHRLIRISVAFVDTDGSIPKLRASLVGLEALGVTSAPTDSKKRPAADMDGDEEDDETQRLRASAVAAVDALENQRKSSQVSSSNILSDINQTAQTTALASVISSSALETELSSDLASMVLDSNNMISSPLLTVQPVSHTAISSDAMFVPTHLSDESYRQQSFQAFQRILDSYQDMKDMTSKELIIHLQLSVRTALAISADVVVANDDNMNCRRKFTLDVAVPVISAIPYNIAKTHSNLPLNVNLPRAVWQLISFALIPSTQAKSSKRDVNEHAFSEKLIYLQALCVTLYNRLSDPNLHFDDANQHYNLYDTVCYVIISRMMQSTAIKHRLHDFLRSLPMIPAMIYELMQVLMYSGTKPVALPTVRGEKGGHTKYKSRGTKVEALHILGQLAMDYAEKVDNQETHVDMELSENIALNHLLWSSLHDDFEIRSKSVTIIVGELSISESMKQTAISFALQSAATVIGVDIVQSLRIRDHLRPFQLQVHADVADMGDNHDGGMAMMDAGTNMIPKDEEKEMMDIVDDIHPTAKAVGQEVTGFQREQYMSVIDAANLYDDGKYFQGSFDIQHDHQLNAIESIYDQPSFEAYVRRKFHLLLQFCLSEYTLLMAVMDLYAAATIANDTQDVDVSLTEAEGGAIKQPTKTTIFHKILLDELANIVPAIARQHRPEVIFHYLMAIDPLAIPLLEAVTQLLLSDNHIPASTPMINYAQEFIAKVFPVDDTLESDPNQEKEAMFIIPLLGGYAIDTIQQVVLPKLVKLFSDKPDILRQAFQRIVSVRPPPVSKAGFVMLLHRMNFESHNIKQKAYLDSINACLSDITTFTGDVIRDAIMQMVEDEVLPVALVRTALLASKAHNDVRKYVLTELIPLLVKKKIWITAPVHWEGVKHCIKTYAVAQSGQNIVEPTFRAVLGLPGAQLKAIIAAAPTIKASLSKLLKVLSMEEKEEVLSGRWAGIQSTEGEALDNEKAKIVKDLMTS